MHSIRPGRWLPSLALAAAVAAAPGGARATSLALYPLDGHGLDRRTMASLHRLVIDAAWEVGGQGERLEPREPMLVARACGSVSAARLACLARLAEGGVLVVGDAERQANTAVVTLRLVDGRGRVSPDVWFRMSSTVLATGPVVQALRELEAALAAGRLTRPAAREPGPRPAEGTAAPPEVMPGLREKPAPPVGAD